MEPDDEGVGMVNGEDDEVQNKRTSEWVENYSYWYMPGTHRDYRFWRKGGVKRFHGGFFDGWEIANSFGLSFQACKHENTFLNIQLVWPNIWIRLPFIKESIKAKDGGMNSPSWGFSLFGNSVHFNWGKKSKIINNPFSYGKCVVEDLLVDGTWQERPKFEVGSKPDKENKKWSKIVPFVYRSYDCEEQRGTALITVERYTWQRRFLPFIKKSRTGINVEFSREVGNRAGSWKGGTVGCSQQLEPGQSPTECFYNMMRTRNFDR